MANYTNEPNRSYGLVKAVRMYEQCKRISELPIIDRYSRLAQPEMYFLGCKCPHPTADARLNCIRRLCG